MTTLSRLLAVLALALLAVSPTVALADDDDEPVVATLPATQVGMTSAHLNATVSPEGHETIYYFEYGATTDYGKQTPVAPLGDGESPVPVSVDVSGLAARTTYHFRVVARNKDGLTRGADRSFTTTAPATPPATTPGGQPPAGGPNTGTPSAGDPGGPPVAGALDTTAPAPVLGRTVVVGEVSGSILVRLPGARGAAPLDAAAGVPVGAVVDARAGVVELSSVAGGRTQAGRFWGAVFQVRQSRSGNGMTDLVLRGGRPEGCGRRQGAARAAAVTAKRPRKGLWGKDKGGRFRTHGRNSVATVRGTKWLVEERCEGTLTRVTEGAVVVRDVRRGRSVTVRADGRYMARDRRAARG
jgi:hypothetical protein